VVVARGPAREAVLARVVAALLAHYLRALRVLLVLQRVGLPGLTNQSAHPFVDQGNCYNHNHPVSQTVLVRAVVAQPELAQRHVCHRDLPPALLAKNWRVPVLLPQPSAAKRVHLENINWLLVPKDACFIEVPVPQGKS
jgi:hypothetical protein